MNKYYTIRNKALATAIAYVTDEKFYTYDDGYSFVRTKKFNQALNEIQELKNKLKEIK